MAGSYDDYFAAIQRDNPGSLRSLLEQGFDPNTPDANGRSGYALALRADATRVALLLIAHPAFDINGLNAAGESPLMLAAIKGDVAVSRRLIERGARVNLPGWTPLHYAASGPAPELVGLLLDRGAEVDALSPNGTTPLMMAARYGSWEGVELLLARGADPNRRNQLDLGPVEFAAEAGRNRFAAVLRERSSRPR
ncbi:MAG: ankyrin repeat domain-containing protein [Burkholderiaceae bacterium]